MTPVLARAPALGDAKLRSVGLASVWVKPGRYFNTQYRLQLDDPDQQPILVSAFAMDGFRGPQAIEATGAHVCAGAGHERCRLCVTRLVDPGILLQRFPVDYRLPTLPACLDLQRVNAALPEGMEFSSLEIVAYRPGMRCQIRFSGSDGSQVYGKVVVEKYGRSSAVDVQREVAAALAASHRRFDVPTPLAYLPELQLQLSSGVSGKSFRNAVYRKRNLDKKIRILGRALADFHSIEAGPELRRYGIFDELDLLDRWVSLIARIFPELARPLEALHSDILYHRPSDKRPRALLHRDFYDQQVLFTEGRPAFVDMDTTSRGDRELDLGNFSAHMRVRGLQWDQRHRCRELAEQFVEAYPRQIEPSRVDWYRKATLLRLACVYSLRPGLHHLALELIDEGMKD